MTNIKSCSCGSSHAAGKRGSYKGSVGAGFKSFGEGVEAAKSAATEVLINPSCSGTHLERKALAVLRQAGRRQGRAIAR